MGLQSRAFSGDARLEAAAVTDSSHIAPGSQGPHVGKIQIALNNLDRAGLVADEVYGPRTANAVLAYKRKRGIINRNYQTSADNIVGKMTMAALDREMLELETLPTGRTRFLPIFPTQRAPQASDIVPRTASRLVLGFAGSNPIADQFPSLPPFLTFTPSILELHQSEVGSFIVENGVGKEIVCQDRGIATIAPTNLSPNSHTLTRIKITKNPEHIIVFPKGAGRTSITLRPFDIFDPIMTISIIAEVAIFFHFVDGPPGIKTIRKQGDLSAILQTIKDIYQRERSGLTFINKGVNSNLRVAGLQTPAVRVNLNGSTPDTNAIKANARTNFLFNVFFVGDLVDVTNMSGVGQELLTITSKPPDDDQPLRCCIFRDSKRDDPPSTNPGKTLAHEAGHALGEDDDLKDTSSLMFHSQSGATDTKISRGMAERMLSSFKAFPP